VQRPPSGPSGHLPHDGGGKEGVRPHSRVARVNLGLTARAAEWRRIFRAAPLTAILDLLRSGAFVTRERIVLWPSALLIGFAAALIFFAVTAHGNSDYHGRPLGSDFSNVYAAGTFVREGKPAAPFDPQLQRTREELIFGKATPFYGWHYPPFFLLIAAPLAHLSYLPALLVWQISTLALYLLALTKLLRTGPAPRLVKDPLWILLAVAFPAVFVNLIHGHNGFLTTALLAGGLACLDERPILAGILFGLLAYKPQFVVMIPLVLIATARWRALGAAALTVAALACVVTAIFGVEVWGAFLASAHFTRTVVLEQGSTGFNKIQSVFAWVRMWGGPVPLAYAVQGAVSIATAFCLVRVWRGPASPSEKGALLCLAAILTTPYSLDYDLMALAPAIALLAGQGIARGFCPYEKTMLVALWIVPIVTRGVAAATLLPLGVVTMLAAAAFIVARSEQNSDLVGDDRQFARLSASTS
jgi:alpha-1,2-mannosyltransferase